MKTPDDALRKFLATVGEITSCVTTRRHVVRPYISRSGRGQKVLLPVPGVLRAADGSRSGLNFDYQFIVLAVREETELATTWSMSTQAYEYRLLDNDHRELLVYHWQPDALGPDFPHLHVSASLDAQFDALTRHEIALDKRHLATGQVSLAAMVRMLITEFDIRPLHADWEARLDLAEAH